MDSPWPMQGYDRRHTGRSPYSTETNTGVEIWRFQTEEFGWIMRGPAIGSDGTIYVGSGDRYLYALNQDGTEKWKYKVNYRIETCPIVAEDGTIYFADNHINFFALNPNGTLKWIFKMDDDIWDSPIMGDDGRIYLGTSAGTLYSINQDGTENWSFNTSDSIYSSPAIGDDGAVYIGSYDGYFYAVYPNGTQRWIFYGDGIIRSSPTIADDGIIYIEIGGELYALNPNNGTVRWMLDNVGMAHNHPVLGEDGTLYLGTSNYRFYAINPDGTIKWEYNPGESSALWEGSAAVSSDGTIYFGTHVGYDSSYAGDIIALNPDGTLKWRKRIANMWIASSPAIGVDGTVYIGSLNRDEGGGESYGFLHAFNSGISNNAPTAPIINGPSKGKSGENYEYTFTSTDANNEEIYYYVNWESSGKYADWYGPFESGYILTLNHSFPGRHNTIRAKARDSFGEDSELSTLEVTMPRNKPYINLYHWLLDILDRWEVLLDK